MNDELVFEYLDYIYTMLSLVTIKNHTDLPSHILNIPSKINIFYKK